MIPFSFYLLSYWRDEMVKHKVDFFFFQTQQACTYFDTYQQFIFYIILIDIKVTLIRTEYQFTHYQIFCNRKKMYLPDSFQHNLIKTKNNTDSNNMTLNNFQNSINLRKQTKIKSIVGAYLIENLNNEVFNSKYVLWNSFQY